MPRSIRTKLLLSHFALILLGALAFGVGGGLLLQRQLTSAETEKLRMIATMTARETEEFLQAQRKILSKIAEGRDVQRFSASPQALALTRYLTKFETYFPALFYWNAENVVDIAVRNDEVYPLLEGDPDLFLQQLVRAHPGVVQIGRVSNPLNGSGPSLSMAFGIKSDLDDTYVGMLQGTFPLWQLSALLDAIAGDSAGRIALIDDSGDILSVSNLDADFRALGEDRRILLPQIDRSDAGAGRLTFLGVDSLVVHADVPSTGWSVVVALPYAEFAAGPQRLRNHYLLLLLAVAGCGALFAWLLATRITEPLLAVTTAARAVASGRAETIPVSRSRDEVGELVDSFNRMIHELQTTTVGRDQLDNILGSMHDALFVVGSDGRIRLVNRAFCALFDLTRESISGQPFDDTIGKRFLDFDCFSVLQQFKAQDVFETFLRGNDGRTLPVILSISPLLEPGGTARGLVGLIQDISERKASEEKIRNSRNFLETVLNSMGDAISIVDAESLVIVGANQVFLDRAGHSEDEVVGQTCYALAVHECLPERRTPAGCPVLRTVASGVAARGEYEHRNAQGEVIYVGVKTSPIKGEDGTVTAVVHVARDISERKRAEQELQAFAAKLEQSNRELTDFAYVASHDLQEPLRKVTAFGDRLKSKYAEVLGEQGLDYLERMRHAAVRMQTLIDDLLSFSRVTTKAQPFVQVALGEIVREVLLDLEIRIQELQGVVEVGDLPTIAADPLQMRQITQNLIGNALKFHRPGVAPSIRVQGELIDDGCRCRITVADNGIGFEEQYCERIFGVFQRLHGRNEYAGSGVGLAICRKITDRHRGSVTATSVLGEGTTFIVTLPVSQNKEDA